MAESLGRLSDDDFASLRPGLIAVVRRVLPLWLRDQAEDLVQAAIVQVLERLRAEGGNLEVSSSYLMRAAHNAAIDEIRRRFRRPEVAMEEKTTADVPAGGAGPARRAESREVDREIRACLGTLAPPRRAAVVLFLLGYSLAETEAMSGWGRKRSEHLTYRGLDDMRRCLTAKGIAP